MVGKRFRIGSFSLAEVLVTLVIIGVVAGITIPIISNYANEYATVVKVKKVYSTLNNAFNLAVAENGPPETWDLSQRGNLIKIIAPYLNVTKTCFPQVAPNNNCLPDDLYDDLNGAGRYGRLAVWNSYNTWYSLSFLDGTGLIEMYSDNGCTNAGWQCGVLLFNVNNKKGGLNAYGKDHFQIFLFKKGFVFQDYNSPDSTIKNNCNNKSLGGNSQGAICAAWIMRWENMDYLRK